VLKNVDNAEDVKRIVSSMPAVAKDGVVYLEDLQQLLTQVLVLLKTTGLGLGGLMLLTAGVLIYNAIRLTIVARRQEMRIMHLVGATKSTVVLPLLIEGVLQGAAGGLLATGLLWSGHRALAGLLEKSTSLFRLPGLPVGYWLTVLVGVGAIYGFVCSLMAVRGPMELRWFQMWKWRRHDRIAAGAKVA
jgi:cell division transport system permease protein